MFKAFFAHQNWAAAVSFRDDGIKWARIEVTVGEVASKPLAYTHNSIPNNHNSGNGSLQGLFK